MTTTAVVAGICAATTTRIGDDAHTLTCTQPPGHQPPHVDPSGTSWHRPKDKEGPAVTTTPTHPGLPANFTDSPDSRIVYGVAAWWAYEQPDVCNHDTLYVHTHDQRRAAAALSAMIRAANEVEDHPVPRRGWRVAAVGWCELVTTCGCTPEQHAAHEDAWEGCDGTDHPCRNPLVSLPPCAGGDDAWSWAVSDWRHPRTPDALPYTLWTRRRD